MTAYPDRTLRILDRESFQLAEIHSQSPGRSALVYVRVKEFLDPARQWKGFNEPTRILHSPRWRGGRLAAEHVRTAAGSTI